jgi:tRNA(fMet)-specific endonuclease VapC
VELLDSDHGVAILRGQLGVRVWAAPAESLAVTAISVGELTHGARQSARAEENLARLGVLLAALLVLPLDAPAARQFGRLKARLAREGNPIEVPLVTHNTQPFSHLPGLVLEDWLA